MPGNHHAHYVAEHLRSEDRREVETATGLDAAVAVMRGIEQCYKTYVVLSERDHQRWVPIAVFGSAPSTATNCVVVWFLSTDLTRREMLGIRRATPFWLGKLGEGFHWMHNLLDVRNLQHLRWCMAVGFQAGDTIRVNGKPFLHVMRPCVIPQS